HMLSHEGSWAFLQHTQSECVGVRGRDKKDMAHPQGGGIFRRSVLYFYPDVAVACGEQDEAMLTSPVVIVEVLSPATEKRDRAAKFQASKVLFSLQEYVLVGSQYKGIDVYRREGAFWKQYSYREGEV